MTNQENNISELESLKIKMSELKAELLLLEIEKEKRADELVIANKELLFQNSEKEKRAAELVIANKELLFQNSEKEKRAAELVIANKELLFQNSEKEKRAAELVIANKELLFQNSEKEKRAAELFLEKQLFEKTLISIGDGLISINADKNIVFMNKIAETLTGWTKEEASGKSIYSVFNIMSEYTRKPDEDIIEKVFDTKTIHNLANHTILITKEGKENLIEDSAAPIFDKDNNITGVVVVFRDYSEKWKRLKQIEYLNFHDDLTGLFNRRFFEEELLRLDVPRNLPISIIMADINGLKLINDSFGHLVGDEMLRKTASCLKEVCRGDEIIARLGGDEFGIILPQYNETQAEFIINRIKDSLKKERVYKFELSVSFGFGCKTKPEKSIQVALKESEDYMYRHKLFESSSMRSKTVELISQTLFEKNGRELLHSKRVSRLCELFALKLGFDMDHVEFLKTTGLMHDIGKIAIEETVLNKKGKLTLDEYNEIKKHPEIGYRILCSVSEFSEAAIHVLQHHEKWDGTGYPQGLIGKEISLDARIITLSDAYDAMTRSRTYREVLTKDQAIVEIRKYLGTQFDPELGSVFIELISESTDI
jgi:diguanylate cyclase